jgi:hypothetical protein
MTEKNNGRENATSMTKYFLFFLIFFFRHLSAWCRIQANRPQDSPTARHYLHLIERREREGVNKGGKERGREGVEEKQVI